MIPQENPCQIPAHFAPTSELDQAVSMLVEIRNRIETKSPADLSEAANLIDTVLVLFRENCEQDMHPQGAYPCAKNASGDTPLTLREREILTWVSRGKTNSIIAQILGISRHTVDTHVRRIFRKLDTNDRTTAAVKAIDLGVLRAA